MSETLSGTTEQSPETKTEQVPEKIQPGFWSFENLRSLGLLILFILALRSIVASPYHVPTASMEPTIKVGDRLLAYKLSYRLRIPFYDQLDSLFDTLGFDIPTTLVEWGKPERGDIIVFKYPLNPDVDYVKRVVAIAGDKVQMIDDILHINGNPQRKVDHNHDRSILDDIEDLKEIKQLYRETLMGKDHWVIQNIPSSRRFASRNWHADEPYIVPDDAVFVIGDNRDNSTDSRVWQHVPIDYIRGKALFVIWSFYKPRESNWPEFRFTRFGQKLD